MTKATEVKRTVLEQAHEIIHGDREQTYGHPSKNLESIASYWRTHIKAKFGVDLELSAEDVCIMMTQLKLARLANTPAHRDSVVDGVGYLALIERCQKNGTLK